MHKYPYPFAVPSWVLPGDAKENILFLHGKIMEISLLCMEPSRPAIDDFLDTPCRWHLHLPIYVPHDFFQEKEKYHEFPSVYGEDIQWENPWVLAQNAEDIDFYAHCCVSIVKHCKKINPWVSVVHLPPQSQNAKENITQFLEYWQSHLPLNTLALENVRDAAHQNYEETLSQENYKDVLLCLDIAHAITYGQKSILDNNALISKVALVHWSAPYPEASPYEIETQYKNKDMHLPLYHLKPELTFCQNAINTISKDAVHVIEVFDWQGIEDSVDFFKALVNGKDLHQ